MSLSDTISNVEKRVATIVKLGKSETDDKKKVAYLKEVASTIKTAKEMDKKKTELNKKIKEAKTLAKEIENFRKEWGTFVKDAAALGARSNKDCNPDTKARDYFMMGNYLSMMGQDTLEDYP